MTMLFNPDDCCVAVAAELVTLPLWALTGCHPHLTAGWSGTGSPRLSPRLDCEGLACSASAQGLWPVHLVSFGRRALIGWKADSTEIM